MSQYGLYCYHSCQVWHWSIVRLSMDSIVIIAVRSDTGVLYVSVWILLLSQLSGLALEYCTSQYGLYCYHSCQVWHWSIVCLSMDSIVIIAVRSGTGVLYVSVWILLLSQLSGLALEYCMSQYGLYCYHSCQVWHWSIVRLSMDSIVIIAVRSGTGVLYVSVWILLLSQLSGLALEYCTSQYGFYCYHSCQVWHWSIVCLSMDYIVIIAVRSSTGVLYVSVWILLLSQLSGLALEYCMSQYGLYCYHSCQVWHWSIVCLSMDSIVIIAVRSGTGVLYVSVWIILLSQLSGLALEYCTSQYGFYCYHSCQVWHWSIVSQYGLYCDHSCQVWHWSIVRLSMDYIAYHSCQSGTGVLYVSVWILLLSQLSGLALEYCMSQYGFYCYHSCQVWHWSIVRLSMDSIVIIAVRSGSGVLYVSVWILL